MSAGLLLGYLKPSLHPSTFARPMKLSLKQMKIVGRIFASAASAGGASSVAGAINLLLGVTDLHEARGEDDPIRKAFKQIESSVEEGTAAAFAAEYGPSWESDLKLAATLEALPEAIEVYALKEDIAFSENLDPERIARKVVLAAEETRDDLFRIGEPGERLLFLSVREAYKVALENKEFALSNFSRAHREILNRIDELSSKLTEAKSWASEQVRSLTDVTRMAQEAANQGRLNDADTLLDLARKALKDLETLRHHVPIPKLSPECFPPGMKVFRFVPGEILKIRVPDIKAHVVRSAVTLPIYSSVSIGFLTALGPAAIVPGLALWAYQAFRGGSVITIKLRTGSFVFSCPGHASWREVPHNLSLSQTKGGDEWVTELTLARLIPLWIHRSKRQEEGPTLIRPFVDALRAELGLPVQVADGIFLAPSPS